MLPHPKGEPASIAFAFMECSLGMGKIETDGLDDYARDSLRRLKELMDASGLKDPADRGMHTIKAEKLTIEQRRELSSAVDELASWFDMKTRTAIETTKVD